MGHRTGYLDGVNWGRLVLSFHPDELLMIARTLRHYQPDRRMDLTSPGVSVLWHTENQEVARVWLAHIGLTLGATAVTILLKLMAEASERIIHGAPAWGTWTDQPARPGADAGLSMGRAIELTQARTDAQCGSVW